MENRSSGSACFSVPPSAAFFPNCGTLRFFHSRALCSLRLADLSAFGLVGKSAATIFKREQEHLPVRLGQVLSFP